MNNGNLVIKQTRLKSKDPKYLNEERYFGGYIDLGALGLAQQWVYEKEAKLLTLKEAEQLFFNLVAVDKHKNYSYELLSK